MAGQMEGKVALVTGAGSGIGRASALLFARTGAKVTVADLAVDGGEETVRRIRDDGGDATFVRCDVARGSDVAAMVARTVDTYGRLDYAFNNAGIEGTPGNLIADVREEDWDRVHAINLKGVWLCMKHELRQMLGQGGGAIVNTASAAALVGWPEGSVYAAAKSGVVSLTKTAALEYASKGIRVNAVCPGFIHTAMAERMFVTYPTLPQLYAEMTPTGRIGTAEEVADVVVWLCSNAASFVTGVALPVDGGLMAGQAAPPVGVGSE